MKTAPVPLTVTRVSRIPCDSGSLKERMMRKFLSAAAVVAVIVGLAGTARADVIFTLGNNPQPGEMNILFGAAQTGTTITGQVGTHTNIGVDFTSLTGQILDQDAKGQADIQNNADPGKALLNSLQITVPGYTFGDFIMNPLNGTGTATITVTDNFSHVFSYDLGNGQNYLTITTANGESIAMIQITMGNPGTEGFIEFKQPRISEVCNADGCVPPPPVPEPASLLLLGTGLTGTAAVIRRRLRR